MQKKTFRFSLTFICSFKWMYHTLAIFLSLSLPVRKQNSENLKMSFHTCVLHSVVCVVSSITISFKEFVGNCNKMLIFSVVVVVNVRAARLILRKQEWLFKKAQNKHKNLENYLLGNYKYGA